MSADDPKRTLVLPLCIVLTPGPVRVLDFAAIMASLALQGSVAGGPAVLKRTAPKVIRPGGITATHVRYWHKADIARIAIDVHFRG
jgi:hypothetical protein